MPTAKLDITVDHIAHFLPDIDAASVALMQLGFTLTPFSAQSHRLQPDGPLTPAGTGNRCIMLRNGYVEFLMPIHETPNAKQLRDAIARYTGVHLIAFGTQAPEADFSRLEREGFAPLPPVALQRQVGIENGAEATARFTVVRVPPAAMAEGRIQYCQHHTPDVVWQPRWVSHPNHAVGLAAILVCVENPAAAAHRYARFSGLPAQQAGCSWRIDTARGYLLYMTAAVLQQWLNVAAPTVPWIAGYVIDSDDITTTRATVNGRDVSGTKGTMQIRLPYALGGIMLFQPSGSAPLQPTAE